MENREWVVLLDEIGKEGERKTGRERVREREGERESDCDSDSDSEIESESDSDSDSVLERGREGGDGHAGV